MIRYFLLANLYTALFYGLYLVLLKGRPFHSWSRFYLLAAVMAGLLLPCIRPDLSGWADIRAIHPIPQQYLPELFIGTDTIQQKPGISAALPAAGSIYLLLLCFLLARFLYRVVRLQLFLGRLRFTRHGRFRLALDTGMGPASFGKTIIFPGSTVEKAILEHEKAHLRYRHHYDKVAMQLLRCFFFPVIPLLPVSRELALVHEFEADADAAADTGSYIALLLGQHAGVFQPYFLQSFFHHPLKRRIIMLQQHRAPGKGRRGILLFSCMLAIAAILLVQGHIPLAAQPAADRDTEDLATAAAYPGLTDKAAALPGAGQEPQPEAAPADPIAPAAPLNTETTEAPQVQEKEESEKIYRSVERLPAFPGGHDSLMRFLAHNIKYPESAGRDSVSGRIVTQFVIDETGKVTNVELLRGLRADCDAEVLRAINMMPAWEPGEQDGKKVKVLYTLPVSFSLNGSAGPRYKTNEAGDR